MLKLHTLHEPNKVLENPTPTPKNASVSVCPARSPIQEIFRCWLSKTLKSPTKAEQKQLDSRKVQVKAARPSRCLARLDRCGVKVVALRIQPGSAEGPL